MKKILLTISIAVLALIGVVWIFVANLNSFLLNPFEASLVFEYPSYAVADEQGNSYLIDRSLKRVTKTTASGNLAFVIRGGERSPGSFYFADEVTVDQKGYVYLLNRIPDPPGFYTVAAEILRYTPEGVFDGVVYHKDYPEESRKPTLVQRGQLHSLRSQNGVVRWFDSTPDGLDLYQVKTSGGLPEKAQIFSNISADLLVSSADVLPDGATVYISKRGQIIKRSSQGGVVSLYDSSLEKAGGLTTPWKLKTDRTGRIFFTDLEKKAIRELLPDGSVKDFFTVATLKAQGMDIPESVYYSLSGTPSGVLGTCGDSGAFFISSTGKASTLVSAAYSWMAIALHVGLWALILIAAGLLFLIGWKVYKDAFKGKIPPLLKTVAGVVLVTAAVGVLVAGIILNNFSQRYSTEVLNKITQLVHLVPKLIDADKLMSIREPAQFGGPEYLEIRSKVIDAIYGEKNQDNKGLYFALHRVKDGQLYTFMYLNGEPTIYHPFSYLSDPAGPYQASLKGETTAQYSLDAWGSWMYSTGPIKDKNGKVVGVFEMGGDLYSFTQENNRLIQSILVNILTILVIFILLIVEGTFLSEQIRKKRHLAQLTGKGIVPQRSEDRFIKTYLVRPLSVMFFVSASMSLMFLPLMMKNFYHPLWGLPESLVYGLPISTRLFFFGIGTILAGSITNKVGWRKVFFTGLFLSAVGLLGAALSTEMALFMASSVFIGFGAGFAVIGMRSLINREPDRDNKASGFSHFYSGIIAGTNVGVIAGSWLADLIGYSNVFYVSLALTLATVFVCVKLFPKGEDLAPLPPSEIKTGQAIRLFFLNPQVLSLFLFIVLPVYVASMFLYFFMPVFAGSLNIANADIGRIFILNGLMVIYLGPVLSRFFMKNLGPQKALYFSSMLWVVSLIPFMLMGNILGVIISVILMGIAEGVAVVTQNEHLLSLRASLEIGPDRATGFFEVVGKLGETIAPIIIGFAILLGPQWGFAMVDGVMMATLALFFFIQAFSNRKIPQGGTL